jgi:hypothetical protein
VTKTEYKVISGNDVKKINSDNPVWKTTFDLGNIDPTGEAILMLETKGIYKDDNPPVEVQINGKSVGNLTSSQEDTYYTQIITLPNNSFESKSNNFCVKISNAKLTPFGIKITDAF